jgi:adenine deaminase
MNVNRMASLAAANNFGLTDRGNIAPNKKADIVLLSDLETCAIKHVIKDGALVTDNSFANRPKIRMRGLNSVHLGKINADQLQLAPQNGNIVPVAQIEAGSLLTPGINVTLNVENGHLQADTAQDVLKCAVLERHGKTDGNIGIGFVKGFGFKDGAIAASVGHDDHNITVVGANDDDMALAANEIANMGGGYVVVKDNTVLARLALPIAGLISDQPFEKVAAEEEKIRTAAASLVPEGQDGLSQPLISLAFISLSVIPFIRICDAGITDNQGTGPTLIWDQRKP